MLYMSIIRVDSPKKLAGHRCFYVNNSMCKWMQLRETRGRQIELEVAIGVAVGMGLYQKHDHLTTLKYRKTKNINVFLYTSNAHIF